MMILTRNLFFVLLLNISINCLMPQSLPTLYQYYTSGGVKQGLEATSDQFTLNGKSIVLFSGSMHYFRVVPERWRETLLKFKAAGLNTVQTYLAWNLHEDTPGNFDFESASLNLSAFLQEIKAADMFAIVRVGPYICAEWEFGGLPSWLLRDPNMQLRTSYPPFIKAVQRFFDRVFPIVNQYQFSVNGGPVIALQFENEYFGVDIPHSIDYMKTIQKLVLATNFTQLLFTSDPVEIANKVPNRALENVLETANLNENALETLLVMRQNQPNRPIYVSEFWPGWYDQWKDKQHHRYDVAKFEKEVSDILFRINGSINFYMFIGGTNFGFMNGDRVTTSYDYDAPLSEAANYTDKYWKTRELYQKMVLLDKMPKLYLPDPPKVSVARSYGVVTMKQVLPMEYLLHLVPKFTLNSPVYMENLNISSNYGQRYGFILYRFESTPIKKFEIRGPINDRAVLMIDNCSIAIIEDDKENFVINLDSKLFPDNNRTYKFDVLVENLGRKKFGSDLDTQRKGINGLFLTDGYIQNNISIYHLDFNQRFVHNLNTIPHWTPYVFKQNQTGPSLYRAEFKINEPEDTFLLLPGWTKGIVFVNGFNLGRYYNVGPQKTLYIPGPLLENGLNDILIFELHQPSLDVRFIDRPILE